ncbi:MAG: hypothetical protein HYU64_21865 [Armatimonadetes bacterium]|nr:hypothetical protein [Armatimonadota bacterium]
MKFYKTAEEVKKNLQKKLKECQKALPKMEKELREARESAGDSSQVYFRDAFEERLEELTVELKGVQRQIHRLELILRNLPLPLAKSEMELTLRELEEFGF